MFCPKKFFDFFFKPVLLDRSHQYKSHGAFSFFLCPIFAENKAGYTAADASGSAISLFPAARLCACVCVCVCARVCARARVCVLLFLVIAAPLTLSLSFSFAASLARLLA